MGQAPRCGTARFIRSAGSGERNARMMRQRPAQELRFLTGTNVVTGPDALHMVDISSGRLEAVDPHGP